MEEAATSIELRHNTLSTWRMRCAFAVCLCMSLFHLYTSGVELLRQPIQRSLHIGFTLVIIFLLFPLKNRKLAGIDGLCLAASVMGTGYVALFVDDIASRGGVILPYEVVLGLCTMAVVLEAGRRVLGNILPLLAVVFLLYCRFGSYAPDFMVIRGYSISRIVQHMYLTSEGLFGVAAGVSSTYIFMFILFGAFLVSGGGAQLFSGLSMALAGRFAGGPAKVAVIASGLMGMINGSSIANAATVGTLTIPMMKKVGYSPEEAAAIEACASTGGQLMPPIMGAGAFIMAEFLSLPYQTIAIAAILPSLLYYGAVFAHVHFVARRDNIRGLSTSRTVWAIMKKDGYLLLPIFMIIGLLVMHYTPLKAAFWAIITVFCLSMLTKANRPGPAKLADTLVSGARGAVGTAIACAVVGFIVGTCSLTALGMSFSGNIVNMTNGSLLPALVISMLVCLVFGMGLPTTANYIVTSTIIAPVLAKMGVPGLAAHLFVFYFGIKADITPPVCLATLTAAGIAGADQTKAGVLAFTIALPSFFLPYRFIYSPDVLLQGDPWRALPVVFFAACGIFGLTGFATGWLARPIGPVLRGVCLLAGVLCYLPMLPLKLAGAAGLVALTVLLKYVWKRPADEESLNGASAEKAETEA